MGRMPDAAKYNTAFHRLIAGGPTRRTRLHDALGRRVPLDRVLRNAAPALATGLARLLFDRRPERPWISYDAQTAIAAFLTPEKSMLEFGSGMSTVWYGKHAGSVVSIEDHREWFKVVEQLVAPLPTIDLRWAETRADYIALAPDRPYDLIMIDGNWRDECADFAIAHLAPGGIVYLDNCDRDFTAQPIGDIPRAARVLHDFARDRGLPVREFTDFAPTQLFVERGLMIGGPA